MKSQIDNRNSRIVIAGAGPAGSSLAVRLANLGFKVTLIEREKFPRHKLCGEFISPECLRHFAELGVLEAMLSAGGERIFETRFYDRGGRSFAVPSSLLDKNGFALSLSRAEMDRLLLEQARAAGVEVLEGTRISEAVLEDRKIIGLRTIDGEKTEKFITADLFIDATGRSLALSKLVGRKLDVQPNNGVSSKSLAIGFKNHLRGAQIAKGVCEIFAFPGGYGGLTTVENGLANLCFLIDSHAARRIGGNADELVANALCRNKMAAKALEHAQPVRDWLAVSISSFGQATPAKAANLLTVGDAAAFIDPFTGSGMLMALESSRLLAERIETEQRSVEFIAEEYQTDYQRQFARRLRVCSLLRRATRLPFFPTAAISFLNFSKLSRNLLAASTRTTKPLGRKPAEPLGNR